MKAIEARKNYESYIVKTSIHYIESIIKKVSKLGGYRVFDYYEVITDVNLIDKVLKKLSKKGYEIYDDRENAFFQISWYNVKKGKKGKIIKEEYR